MIPAAALRAGDRLALSAVPDGSPSEFQDALREDVASGARVALLAGIDLADGGLRVISILANDTEGILESRATRLHPGEKSWPSLAREIPAVERFERELLERHGLVPVGHPWPAPVRGEARPGAAAPPLPEKAPWYAMEGEEVHEVAVGPVHAGIIEPGHFRFQCHGEDVLHLEIRLGYQHRGAERLLESASGARRMVLLESLAGDTAVAHALAGAEAIEALSGVHAPPRAAVLRSVALEIERLANHVGDLGALSGDVAYLPGAAWLGGLRGDFLNLLTAWTGNRFGRGLVVPGGVRSDLPDEARAALLAGVSAAGERATEIVDHLFSTSSVVARFEGTGVVSPETARSLGLVGVAARACGMAIDARADHPTGAYRFARVAAETAEGGDVHARALVRRQEIRASVEFVREQLSALPPGPLRVDVPPPAPDSIAVGLIEGWRGECFHLVATDASGRVVRHKAKDPSFHDWIGLSSALRGEAISDFPLINKSFNLSYAGHDL